MTDDDWRPSAPIENLRARAEVIDGIRAFFRKRGVLEVETPVLSAATVTDLHLHSLTSRVAGHPKVYLQTSPEYAMKRLLAAGSGAIYQITRAFRDAERGRRHNPEFTILEWYRPGFDHHRLMDEMDDLLRALLGCETADRLTWAEVFASRAGIEVHSAGVDELRHCARAHGLNDDLDLDRDGWIDLILSHVIEPQLGQSRPTFVYDYPADRAALAQVRDGAPPLAERFEVYVKGIELANGYHELGDADEQRRRFERDLRARRDRGLSQVAVDHRLLAALEHGLPACAGVALGVDRLVMLRLGVESIDEVIAFPIDRA